MTDDDRKFAAMLSDQLRWLAYGGDESLYPALKGFLAAVPDGRSYDHRVLSAAVGPAAWMLIYSFVALDWINYGTSPRHGWLEGNGEWLWRYAATHTAEEMQAIHQADDDSDA